MDTIIFWIAGGVITAVIVLIVWRQITTARRSWRPPQTSEIPISHYHEANLPSLPDINSSSAVDEPAADEGNEPVAADGPAAMTLGEPGTRDVAEAQQETLRMDVAVPPKVEVGRAFDMAVALRQANAPQLAEEDLTKVASGPVAVVWEEAAEQVVVRIQVTAPDCEIDEPEQTITLTRGQDEPPVYFLLTPQRNGRISIQVKVYQEALLLGNARIKTEAAEEAGQVEMVVTSYPLSLTANDRRLLWQNLTDAFDLGELHDLIFLLGLDKDNFPQEKDELIVDLIQTCLRQGLVPDLLTMGAEKRPFLTWKLDTIPG
ncbi:MAG: hypothetical protein H6667_15905 [Ardenticatenaceae bacterium]|nr:hypothetical protein [Ardenticatenaceae bacterium]MCB9443694.1 hypothetical protein [Ardenticatenaceae bacterium]